MVTERNACEKPPEPPAANQPGKRPKRSGGRGNVSKHPPENLIRAALAEAVLVGQGEGIRGNGDLSKVRAEMGMSDRAAEWVRKSCGLAPEEFRERLAVRMEAVIAQILARLEERVGEMAPRDLPFAFGILNDHLMKTRGFGAPVTLHQTNIQINGMARNSAIEALTGKRSLSGTDTPKPARAVGAAALQASLQASPQSATGAKPGEYQGNPVITLEAGCAVLPTDSVPPSDTPEN